MIRRKLGDEVLVIRDGTHRGKIVGRTFEQHTRYNVQGRDKLFKDITEDELRDIPAPHYAAGNGFAVANGI